MAFLTKREIAKRKYTRFGEKAKAFECTNKKCKWQGQESEKVIVWKSPSYGDHTCPNCANEEFYGLLEIPDTKIENTITLRKSNYDSNRIK